VVRRRVSDKRSREEHQAARRCDQACRHLYSEKWKNGILIYALNEKALIKEVSGAQRAVASAESGDRKRIFESRPGKKGNKLLSATLLSPGKEKEGRYFNEDMRSGKSQN